MTRTTPWRLISLHLSQMRLTLERTFMAPTSKPVFATFKISYNISVYSADKPDSPGNCG